MMMSRKKSCFGGVQQRWEGKGGVGGGVRMDDVQCESNAGEHGSGTKAVHGKLILVGGTVR